MPHRLILADRDATLRATLRLFFESHGFECQEAGSTAQLRAALTPLPQPSLIILDPVFDDGNALNFLSEMRNAAHPEEAGALPPPFVVVYGTVSMIPKAWLRAVDSLRIKPVPLEELRNIVDTLLGARTAEGS